MVAIPAQHSEITKAVVESHSDPCVSFVYLTIETDDDATTLEPIRLCMDGVEAVDDMINKLVAVRNRLWPFPTYQVPA